MSPPHIQGVINTLCGQGVQARSAAEAGTSIHPAGCVAELAGWLRRNLLLLGGIALAVALPQVGTFFSFWGGGCHLGGNPPEELEVGWGRLKGAGAGPWEMGWVFGGGGGTTVAAR